MASEFDEALHGFLLTHKLAIVIYPATAPNVFFVQAVPDEAGPDGVPKGTHPVSDPSLDDAISKVVEEYEDFGFPFVEGDKLQRNGGTAYVRIENVPPWHVSQGPDYDPEESTSYTIIRAGSGFRYDPEGPGGIYEVGNIVRLAKKLSEWQVPREAFDSIVTALDGGARQLFNERSTSPEVVTVNLDTGSVSKTPKATQQRLKAYAQEYFADTFSPEGAKAFADRLFPGIKTAPKTRSRRR